MNLPDRALSIRQPWCSAVIDGGKRIENRGWTNSHFRGPFLIHAAKGMTRREYDDAAAFVEQRRIDVVYGKRRTWYPPSPELLRRGGIVGVANVIGVVARVTAPKKGARAVGMVYSALSPFGRPMTAEEDLWWMGGFALVLDQVKSLPFVECVGRLGFFKVGAKVLRRLHDLDSI